MSWKQFTSSLHRAQKNRARHLKDDPNFYKKRQATYDREGKYNKCVRKNLNSIPLRRTAACLRKYGSNNNESTIGKQMK